MRLWPKRRWTTEVRDVRGVVIHSETHRSRRKAERVGKAITTPPINRYQVRRRR